MDLIEEAISIFKSTLANVDPNLFLPEIIKMDSSTSTFKVYGDEFSINRNQKIYVIGSGKASPTMAEAVEKIFTSNIHAGLIIAPPHSNSNLNTIQMLEGTHPIPDEKSLAATNRYLEFIQTIPSGSYVFNLISGGSSALLCKPVNHISIQDLQKVFQLLIQSGAAIQEVNTVRKSLSQVKGGQLLERLNQVQLLDIIISDVPDDDLRFIGSGPTVAQEISYIQSIVVTEKYSMWNKLPEPVRSHLLTNASKEASKSTPYTTADFQSHYSWIVSSAVKVAKETRLIAQNRGYEVTLFEPAWTGSIEDFEEYIYQQTIQHVNDKSTKRALIFFGECTVTISGDGKGGRNQELALRMANRFSKTDRSLAFLSAGTDGIDGPTDVAGAVINEKTKNKAQKMGLSIDKYLIENNSYHFFKLFGNHIITGPTGNNVMDIQIVLLN